MEQRRLFAFYTIEGADAVAEGSSYTVQLSTDDTGPITWEVDWDGDGPGGAEVVGTFASGTATIDSSNSLYPFIDGPGGNSVAAYANTSAGRLRATPAGAAVVNVGQLDLTFGGTGRVTTPSFAVPDVAVQSDGKVVVAHVNNTGMSVTRYNADGTLDGGPSTNDSNSADTFGTAGTTTFTWGILPGASDSPASIALDSVGRIIVAGGRYNGTLAQHDFAVGRLLTDGSIDASFGNSADPSNPNPLSRGAFKNLGAFDVARGVAVQADGKIVAVGQSNGAGTADFAVVRFNDDGSLDGAANDSGRPADSTPGDSFGTGGAGFQRSDFAGFADVATDVAFGTGGTIVVGGHSGSLSGPNAGQHSLSAVRFTSAGVPDATFNPTPQSGSGLTPGQVRTQYDSVGFNPSVAVDSSGRVLLSGNGDADPFAPDSSDAVVLRYLANGSPDNSFDFDGELVDATPGELDTSNSMALDAQGRIVLTGSATPSVGARRLTITRLNGDGTLDRTFNNTGRVATTFPGSGSEARALAIASDGKYVVAGDGLGVGAVNEIFVARYGGADGVVVNNVAPVAGPAVYDGTIVPGQFEFFDFSATDASPVDAVDFFEFNINWGDGTSDVIGGFSPLIGFVAHTYTRGGPTNISVTVVDKDGGTSAPTLTPVNIVAAAERVADFDNLVSGPNGTPVLDPLTFAPTPTHMLVVGAPDSSTGGGVNNNVDIRMGTGGVEVRVGNVLLGTFNPADANSGFDRIVVRSHGGNDDVTVANSVTLPVEVYGGAGNDRLRGGAGGDILVGGSGDDLLTGSGGRDLLIGDDENAWLNEAQTFPNIGGTDRINGNDHDDILIGGFTTWANRRDAMGAILREWSTVRTYNQRVDNIRTGTGTPDRENQSNVVDPNTNELLFHEDYFLRADVTVRDDLVVDTLTGNQGLDWFFANADGFLRDRVTDLSAAEFADDLDFIFGF